MGIPLELLSRIEAEPEPPWIWDGFIARGQTTLLSGLPKVGKTTLLWYVLRAMAGGGELGGAIHPARVLVLSEEPRALWANRQALNPGGDHIVVGCRCLPAKPTLPQWTQYLQILAKVVQKLQIDLVVIDTWCGVGPVLDENSSGETVAALKPLSLLTGVGAGVLLIHHISKSDAPHAMGARGSNALPGEVDHVVEVRYRDPESKYPNQRHISVKGRYRNHDLMYELREGQEIVNLGSLEEIKGTRWETLEWLISTNPGITVEGILENWPSEAGTAPGKSTVYTWLKAGAKQGRWRAEGDRKGPGQSHRFYLDVSPTTERE